MKQLSNDNTWHLAFTGCITYVDIWKYLRIAIGIINTSYWHLWFKMGTAPHPEILWRAIGNIVLSGCCVEWMRIWGRLAVDIDCCWVDWCPEEIIPPEAVVHWLLVVGQGYYSVWCTAHLQQCPSCRPRRRPDHLAPSAVPMLRCQAYEHPGSSMGCRQQFYPIRCFKYIARHLVHVT